MKQINGDICRMTHTFDEILYDLFNYADINDYQYDTIRPSMNRIADIKSFYSRVYYISFANSVCSMRNVGLYKSSCVFYDGKSKNVPGLYHDLNGNLDDEYSLFLGFFVEEFRDKKFLLSHKDEFYIFLKLFIKSAINDICKKTPYSDGPFKDYLTLFSITYPVYAFMKFTGCIPTANSLGYIFNLDWYKKAICNQKKFNEIMNSDWTDFYKYMSTNVNITTDTAYSLGYDKKGEVLDLATEYIEKKDRIELMSAEPIYKGSGTIKVIIKKNGILIQDFIDINDILKYNKDEG